MVVRLIIIELRLKLMVKYLTKKNSMIKYLDLNTILIGDSTKLQLKILE